MRSQKPVTEKEWALPGGRHLVRHARQSQSARKRLLFTCGFCRVQWNQISDIRIRTAIQKYEDYSEKLSELKLRNKASELIENALVYEPYYVLDRDLRFCVDALRLMYMNNFGVMIPFLKNRKLQNSLIRDIFGNPFRPVAFDPSWQTSATVSLAQSMYDSRDFAAMPVLAEALEEVGCRQEDILGHCRGESATHVRGCWVVDLVLGKA